MAVTLHDLACLRVELADLGPFATGLEHGGAEAETHGASKMRLGALGHEDDDRVGSLGRDLDRVCVLQSADVAGILDNGNLHSEADTQVRDSVLSGPLGGSNHSLSSTRSESTRNQDSVSGAHIVPCLVVFCRVARVGRGLKGLGLNPDEVQLAVAAHRRVLKGLDGGQVRVVKVGVLSDECDGDSVKQVILGEGEGSPLLPERLALLDKRGGDLNLVENQGIGEELDKVLVVEEDRNVVGRVDIVNSNDLLVIDITEQGDLLNGGGVEGLLATAGNLSASKNH